MIFTTSIKMFLTLVQQLLAHECARSCFLQSDLDVLSNLRHKKNLVLRSGLDRLKNLLLALSYRLLGRLPCGAQASPGPRLGRVLPWPPLLATNEAATASGGVAYEHQHLRTVALMGYDARTMQQRARVPPSRFSTAYESDLSKRRPEITCFCIDTVTESTRKNSHPLNSSKFVATDFPCTSEALLE